MNRFLIALALFAFGCSLEPIEFDPPVVFEVTVESWDAMVGSVSANCRAWVAQLPIESRDGIVIDGTRYGGYYSAAFGHATILLDQTEPPEWRSAFLGHEYIHALADCEKHDLDALHTNRLYWATLSGESVESMVREHFGITK